MVADESGTYTESGFGRAREREMCYLGTKYNRIVTCWVMLGSIATTGPVGQKFYNLRSKLLIYL